MGNLRKKKRLANLYRDSFKMRLFITICALSIYIVSTYAVHTVYLDKQCGKSSYADPDIRLKSSMSTYPRGGLNCTYFVSPRTLDRLTIVIRNFNVMCSNGMLKIYDGFMSKSNPISGNLCASSKYGLNKYKFTASSDGAMFEFTTSRLNGPASFDIIVTSYSTGLCIDND